MRRGGGRSDEKEELIKEKRRKRRIGELTDVTKYSAKMENIIENII